jgi:hypothetical protein
MMLSRPLCQTSTLSLTDYRTDAGEHASYLRSRCEFPGFSAAGLIPGAPSEFLFDSQVRTQSILNGDEALRGLPDTNGRITSGKAVPNSYEGSSKQ